VATTPILLPVAMALGAATVFIQYGLHGMH